MVGEGKRKKWSFCVFEPPLGDLGATYDDHLRLTGKRVMDLLLVLIELFFAKCYTKEVPYTLSNEPKMTYVARKSLKGGSKTQNGRFPSKIALLLKKVCYNVFLYENCQRQSRRAFICLTIDAKMIGGDVTFYLKFWVKLTALERNRRFSIYFRPYSASVVTSSENKFNYH